MPLELISGPPGSGKTALLLDQARELCSSGQRVLWIGLPTQRDHILSRLVSQGGLIGFEYVSEQQFCYRLLSRARQLRPLRAGTERLALVGAALAELHQQTPMPGEARLFAASIAELKRHGLSVEDAGSLANDGESARLAEVFKVYEDLKGEAWDYDDYRSHALELARAGHADAGADNLVVSGYRELLPMTIELYRALAGHLQVRIALPAVPPALEDEGTRLTVLPAPQPVPRSSWHAPNEIEEIRWVLRDVKSHLAAGARPDSLAVVAAADQLRMYSALAEEYGVPLRPEEPVTIADTPAGRTLIELIALQEFAGPSALLALPGLGGLAAAALEQRVSGSAALLQLARHLDEEAAAGQAEGEDGGEEEPKRSTSEQLRDWLERLGTDEPGLAWASNLVGLVAEELVPQLQDDPQAREQFRAQALQRASEAARLGSGDSFRSWWTALLEDSRMNPQEPAGVALLSPSFTSGRRYAKAWLTGALEGNYLPGSAEDYFLAEDLRSTQERLGVLPRRFGGQEEVIRQELLQLADELTVTHAESSQGGRNTPQQELTGSGTAPLPPQPAGNEAELTGASHQVLFDHALAPTSVTLPAPEAQWLTRYVVCPQRSWTEELLRRSGDRQLTLPADWQRFRRELVAPGQKSAADLELLATRYPWAADWLELNAPEFMSLTWSFRWPRGESLHARVDATGRRDGTVSVYRFTGPAAVDSPEAATALLRRRTAERWLANNLLQRRSKPEPLVRLFVWPILGEKVEAGTPGGVDVRERWLRHGLALLDDAIELHTMGSVAPIPGWQQCVSCPVYDFCRKGLPR